MQKSKTKLKVQKSTKKIAKLLVLLGIREGYLLVRNVYGIMEHPKLTFGRIVKQKDLSQGILIFGLPAGLWLAWVFILLISRLFIFGRLQFGILAKSSFVLSSIFSLYCLLLITNYFIKVWKKGGRGE